MLDRDLTRRGLLAGAGAGALGLAGLAQAVESLAAVAEAAERSGLAAGLLSPDDPAVRRTMAAFADTIVPGPAGGADRHPGAVEAGAVEVMYDPFYGVSASFPVLHAELQATTPRVLGRPARFDLTLPYADRELVVRDRITQPVEGGPNPLALGYQAAAILVYLAYYGTARSRAGPRYLGFPPESDGYWPDHSYRIRFEGMTKNGHPR